MTKSDTPKTSAGRPRRAKPSLAAADAASVPDVAGPVASSATDAPKAPGGKLGVVIALLNRPEGATLDALTKATGWQAHSVRGAISGSLKKKLGLTIESRMTAAGRVYRIIGTAA